MGVVGRVAVMEQAWAALQDRCAVELEGPAGIGKTTVWTALVALAEKAGMTVLTAAPTEAEQQLPLSALADLLAPVASLVDGLPDPQAAAVRAALLMEGAGQFVDERALGAATRSLFDLAAEQSTGGLLVAVDDAPWLDPPSERALRYAVRRRDRRWALLLSRRAPTDRSAEPTLGLPDDSRTVAVGPLAAPDLRRILGERFERTFPRRALARITHEAGGNPLLAVELARALDRSATPLSSGDDLPVVGSIQDLVEASLAPLPDPAPDAARLAALLTEPTMATITATGVPREAVEAVEDAGILRVEDSGALVFAHPTFATAVRAGIPTGLRRQMHRRLADVCGDLDERARQLARGVVEPDPGIGEEVAAAAARTRAKGAPESAADLYRRAAELTPDDLAAVRMRRYLLAAECLVDSGDYDAAGDLCTTVADATTGDLAAEAWLIRATIGWHRDDLAAAVRDGESALALAQPASLLAGRIHAHLSVFGDLPRVARPHAEAALTLLSPGEGAALSDHDRSVLGAALLQLFLNEVRAGDPPRLELLDQALAEEGETPYWLAGTVPAIWWKAVDDHDRARRRLHWMYERALATGDEPFQHEVATHLGELEILAGRYGDADRWIRLARDLGEQLSSALAAEDWLHGTLDARQGNLEAAAAAAVAGLAAAEAQGDPWRRRLNLQLAGITALADGRAGDAVTAFGQLAEAVDELGLVEPLGSRFEDEWVEALVAVGDLEGAEAACARLAGRHVRLPRPWTRLGVARSRLLIDGARRLPVDDAITELTTALADVAPGTVPLERARCLFAIGVAHRRVRRRRQARESLEPALAEFTALGATAQVARTRAELDRLGARTAFNELSATEERVARLAAAGHTNRAIADELFISPKTVESNLARVYSKLGISRRAELAMALDRP